MAKVQNFTYSRITPCKKNLEVGFYPPQNLQLAAMKEMFSNALLRLEPIISIPKSIIEKTITITEKINEIKLFIKQSIATDFKKILGKGSRADVVISFLAMLELIKQRDIEVEQEGLFNSITIKKAIN